MEKMSKLVAKNRLLLKITFNLHLDGVMQQRFSKTKFIFWVAGMKLTWTICQFMIRTRILGLRQSLFKEYQNLGDDTVQFLCQVVQSCLEALTANFMMISTLFILKLQQNSVYRSEIPVQTKIMQRFWRKIKLTMSF